MHLVKFMSWASWLLVALVCAPVASPQDAKSVISLASKAMGLEGVTSVYYYGSGAQYEIGRNNSPNGPWFLVPMTSYTGAIDFGVGKASVTWSTYGAPVTGGAILKRDHREDFFAKTAQWDKQLEMWLTPWGFLKGAEANQATLSKRVVSGKVYQVITWNAPVKSPGGKAYQIVGYIGPDMLVERVETLVDHPLFGDMRVEVACNFWRDNKGFKFPSQIVQKRAGWPVFDLQVQGAWPNPPRQSAQLVTFDAFPIPGVPMEVASGASSKSSTVPFSTEKLAEGVYRIGGEYSSVAVEFTDHVVLFGPGPRNDDQTRLGLDEAKRLFPDKPIRYGILALHHIDHIGGIATVAAAGVTIVTPEVAEGYVRGLLDAPRTLAPNALTKSGRKPVVEGFRGDKRIFQDATRTLEIHMIRGMPYSDSFALAWLPNEKILVVVDAPTAPPANRRGINPPAIASLVLLQNIEQLGFDQPGVRLVPLHSENRPTTFTIKDVRDSAGNFNF